MNASILTLLPFLLAQEPPPAPVPAAEVPALLDALDRSFAALGRFRADFDVKGIPCGEGGPDLGRIVLHVDPAASRCLIRMYAAGAKEPAIQSQFEGWTVFFWRDAAVAQKIDGALLGRLLKTFGDLEEKIDRLLVRDARGASHPFLHIRIDGKPAEDRKGGFKFAMGFNTGRHASWLSEIASARDAVVRRAEGTIRAELPSSRKEFEIDAATGMLKALRVRDYDGTAREIALAAIAKGEDAPDAGRPATVKSSLPPPDELAAQVDEFVTGRNGGMIAVAKAWTQLDAAKKDGEATTLLSGFYVEVMHLWIDHAMQMFARQYLAKRLAQDATPALLKQNADLEFERFAAAITQGEPAKQFEAFVSDRASRIQHAVRKGLNSALADEKNAEALVNRTLEAAFSKPSIDSGPALIKRARQAFNVVIAHPEEL